MVQSSVPYPLPLRRCGRAKNLAPTNTIAKANNAQVRLLVVFVSLRLTAPHVSFVNFSAMRSSGIVQLDVKQADSAAVRLALGQLHDMSSVEQLYSGRTWTKQRP